MQDKLVYRLKKKLVLSIIVFTLHYLYLFLFNYINLLLKLKDNTKIYAKSFFQIKNAIDNFYIISLKLISNLNEKF